ncbi:hypothetical protein CUU66_21695 [Peribacillus deserti]|uniref:Uncharacterized protein n=1 Tax=Peribacillus deserti TaxID=673318 RepID=A0A2N5M0F5_9BACI|nr:hypothetical protein CUU66_21695 [Peribacillus deserti]
MLHHPIVQSGRLERKVRDSCGSSGTGETPQAKPRRLTARPAESEHPGAEINLLFNSNKVCENSH